MGEDLQIDLIDLSQALYRSQMCLQRHSQVSKVSDLATCQVSIVSLVFKCRAVELFSQLSR